MIHSASRMTRQRRVILETLRNTRSHPTADEVYAAVRARMPRISLGTVYRNLDFLADSGEILKLEAAGSTRRFDGVTAPHRHIRCTCCGRVADVAIVTPEPDPAAVQVEGFTVTGARIEYEGLCDACRPKANPAGPSTLQEKNA